MRIAERKTMKTFKEITEAKRKPMIVVGTKKEIGHRIADIGPGGKEYNVQTNAAWDKAQKDKMKKGMKEAKDKGEYDYEGDMAMSQLKTICRHAEHFMEMLKPDTNLPEWVQSKITLATDYIQTAHDYMMSEMDEAYSDPYAAKKSAEMKKAQAATMADAKKEYDAAKKPKFAKNFMKMKKEETDSTAAEPLKELHKKTYGRYIKLAVDDKSDADFHAGHHAGTDDEDKVHGASADRFKTASVNQAIRRSERRSAGINAAVKKITKEEVEETHEGKIKRAIMGAMAAVALSGAANTAHAQAPQKTSKDSVATATPNDSVATASSRDMQLSVNKAKHELRKKGIEQPSGHRQDVKANADGTYTATVDYRKPKKEEVELTELKNKTLRSYRFKAKIAAPTTRAPGRERAGEILKKRKDAYLAKKATKAFSSKDRLDARTKDVHPYGTDD